MPLPTPSEPSKALPLRHIPRFTRWKLWCQSRPGFVFAIVALLVALGVFGGTILHRELKLRRSQYVAKLWDQVRVFADQQDVANVHKSLDAIEQIQPDDLTVSVWKKALAEGKVENGDPRLIRLVMNENLRSNRLDRAAYEAEKRLANYPTDWQSLCIVAHDALTRGKADEARKLIAKLPSPFELEKGLGPGPLLYAVQLSQSLGQAVPMEWVNFLVLQILPALESSYLPHIPRHEKLQLLEAYSYALTHLDTHPDTGKYWVPAAALGRQLIDDPLIEAADIERLGFMGERMRPQLLELGRRGRIPTDDVARLDQELTARLAETWQKLLVKNPASPAGLIGMAMHEARSGRTSEARSLLEKGFASSGGKTEVLTALSQLLRDIDPVAGVDLLHGIVEKNPDDVMLWQLLADLSLSARRFDMALKSVRAVRPRRPETAWLDMVEAQSLLATGKPQEALAVLERKTGQGINDPIHVALAIQSCLAAGEEKKIDALLQRLDSLNHKAALILGAETLSRAGQNARAASWAERILTRNPDEKTAKFVYAESLRKQAEPNSSRATWDDDQVQFAIKAYESLHQRDTSNLTYANNLAWLKLKALEQPESALRSAAALVAAEKSLAPEMLETLGAIYLELGQPSKATRLLERAAKGLPDSAGIWTHLGRSYLELGRRADARRCFERARDLPRSRREGDELAKAIRQLERLPVKSGL